MVAGGWRFAVIEDDLPGEGFRVALSVPTGGGFNYVSEVTPNGIGVTSVASGDWRFAPSLLIPNDVAVALHGALTERLLGSAPQVLTPTRDERLERWFEAERVRVDRLIGALVHEVGVVDPNGGAGALR